MSQHSSEIPAKTTFFGLQEWAMDGTIISEGKKIRRKVNENTNKLYHFLVYIYPKLLNPPDLVIN